MKKAFFASLIALAISASAFAAPTTVTEKVLKAFSQTFVSAQDVRWSEHRGLFEAHFTFNDIVTRVTYDDEGNAVQTIRYYYEQQLPLNVLARVKNNYEGQKVFGVTEVTTNDHTEYHIVLESATNWTMLVADGTGFLAEEKKMGKA
ncbi:hypothetical protein [Flaviaesturariibacter aridisoli]|uniref:Beta-lactamase-inhibitor-like PepSY-like domain-containing protein n=1 Tax=Flaviaesturariibacter aridisoli TaxID=2545761 RepID=A0A4R4E001_9BACT|nr:hypothetical protein [Flaviaesturariibacter aridisoli]TCZ67087.1 hypothetical protein E0486_16240 [Flaviaesturariibacter aridisoli]